MESVLGREYIVGKLDAVDDDDGCHCCFGVLAYRLEQLLIAFARREGGEVGAEGRGGRDAGGSRLGSEGE